MSDESESPRSRERRGWRHVGAAAHESMEIDPTNGGIDVFPDLVELQPEVPGDASEGRLSGRGIRQSIFSTLLDSPSRGFDLELWDGQLLPAPAGGRTPGRILIRTPAALQRLVPPVDELRVTEAFIAGQVDIVGDTIGVLDAVSRWEGPRLHPLALPWVASSWMRTRATHLVDRCTNQSRHSIRRDGRSIRHHYDVSDDLFRLFLDKRMVYSCAYFPGGGESIDEAQEAKVDLVCRKLALKPGERLLDVGCGWGALLVHAADRFHVAATGTTLNRNQAAEARLRAARSAAGVRIQVLECDYRQLPGGPSDKIVSIGMMEHVGAANLDTYFRALYRRLVPGGLLLNHAIAEAGDGAFTMPWLRGSAGAFIGRKIFRDSEMPSLSTVIAAAERQGFEVRDVDCLREHYAQTLRHWLTRFERRFDEARALVGMRTARAWRLYLAISALAFDRGRLELYQTMLAKKTPRGEVPAVPRFRGDWYRAKGRSAPPSNDAA